MGNDLIIPVGSKLLLSQTENLISSLTLGVQNLYIHFLVYFRESRIPELSDLRERSGAPHDFPHGDS